MKICKDCKHCLDWGLAPDKKYLCTHGNKQIKNLVTGEVYLDARPCAAHRAAGWLESRICGWCGKRGRWFESK